MHVFVRNLEKSQEVALENKIPQRERLAHNFILKDLVRET